MVSDQGRVPPLYWIVNEAGRPVVLEGGVASGEKFDFFPFFTTRENAQTHYDQSYMTNKRVTSSDDPAELKEIVEGAAPDYTAFLIDVAGVPGQDAQPLLAEEVVRIVEDNVGASEWDLGY